MYGFVKGREKLVIQKTKKGYLLALKNGKSEVKNLIAKELNAIDIIAKSFFSAKFYNKINHKFKGA